jgi:integrase
VVAKLRATATDAAAGISRPSGRLTTGAWLDRWLAEYVAGLRPRTQESYRYVVERHLKPAIGRTALARLSHVTAVGLGLRQGEALALRWEDVDLDRGLVHVRHTLRRGDRQIAEPKTERSRRTLLMPAEVVSAVRAQRVRQARERLAAGKRWTDLDYVFTTPTGRALDGVNVTHEFQRALERAGLPRQRFHDLRHAHATLLIEGGVELAVVSRALGHADLSTTADVYGAWTRDMAGRVASRMDEVLRPTKAV